MTNPLAIFSCSRRAFLEGIGASAVAGLVLGACDNNGANLPAATTTTCGSAVCIDLTDPRNADLTEVGGTMAFEATGGKILVARTSETAVIALSAVCTHQGCTVDYDASSGLIECPCHGSEFSTTGAVVRGPASQPLAMYAATLSGTTITVTV